MGMSVVVVGHRRYGRVRMHGGEYAETGFVHLSYLPLWPVGSVWVTNEPGGAAAAAFPIRLHARSVAAAYLRTWGLLLAVCLAVAPDLIANGLAVVVAALCGWSWTSRSRRGVRVLQRSDFDRVALGSRCDPAWMTSAMRDDLSRKLAAQLAERDDARPPDDVARFGPRDLTEATTAYGLLRIAAVDRPDARAAADRLLANAMSPQAQGAPYRDPATEARASVGAQITSLAQAHAAAAEAQMRGGPSRWYHDPWAQLVCAFAATCAAGCMIYREVPAGVVDARALDRDAVPYGRPVTVRCDAIQDIGLEVREDGGVVERVVFCQLGSRILPVVSQDDDDPVEGTVLEGRLQSTDHPTPRQASWLEELRRNPSLDARAFAIDLERENETTHRFALLFLAMFAGVAVVGWSLWITGVLRRRRQPSA